ncbi:MAG: TatD family hydrolase [Blautia sp.]|nr:TatD family hydrolase [Blautia sp.]
MIFDTHAHYDSGQYDEDRDELLASMQAQGVSCIVNSCADVDKFGSTVALMEKYPFVYGTVGVHPDDADKVTKDVLDEIVHLSRHEKTVAIGEIGLDYYWHKEKVEQLRQHGVFRAQMDIARQEKMPFMVHSRDACADTLNIVKEYVDAGMYGGIIHCFSYEKETAREYLKRGLYLGIGGVVTFKNARKLKEVVEYAPLTQLLLETDCPYLSPEPFRGKRNSSANLIYVVKEIARLKGVAEEEVMEVTEQNAYKIFGIKKSKAK